MQAAARNEVKNPHTSSIVENTPRAKAAQYGIKTMITDTVTAKDSICL